MPRPPAVSRPSHRSSPHRNPLESFTIDTHSLAPSPLAAYLQAIEKNGFRPDEAQRQAALLLDDCHRALHQAEYRQPITGVYLWGPVGRGKTWLMDSFHRSLRVPARRQHFHHFMRWVHRRLFQLTGSADPLRLLAAELAGELRVLCFDELFVNDIGDAMLLGPLLQAVFEQGLVVVATSNQPAAQLYADGFNRQRFQPAIAAIERHMQVACVDGGQDHRLHPGARQQRYWVTMPGQASALGEVFARLNRGAPTASTPVQLEHRRLSAVCHGPAAVWCTYAELCEQPFSAFDFIALCDRFPAILLGAVPSLSGRQREGRIARGTEDGIERVVAGDRQLPMLSVHDDGVRRFIALVDECYDRRIPLYLEAEVALEALYTEGYLSFSFRRTLSRLQEMQLQRFG
ncbi:ATPase [Azotobacter vinelandii CA]|uniref:ATPase n=2 Tax=Azotobacter vinelandii TaxID=354 RepID=C1DHH8_AZOVD|nr:cell division protein ZapE [Azotobacter vinelandii]ACO78573.1 ATPase [Azotobacter vinelandii DJ]AGK16691.1 ATPase [Azotobacter vinelandii CA]AGK20595.1 ATPase [Azotobacter vinelandii CA6]SFX58752.1 cell division protein ZapE [Azotobacter vinelandii]GLK61612.1 cell division protein ZapE [Azotobacter vinelandii]